MLLYLTPENTQAKDLDSLGLGHIYDDPSNLVRVPVFNGLFGYGCVFGSRESLPEPEIILALDRQEWTNYGKFAIGKYKGRDYDPASLARPTQIDSHPWKDINGKTWQIPIARRWFDHGGQYVTRCELPRFLSIDESGQWQHGGVLEKYESLWDLACTFHDNRAEAMAKAEPGQSVSFAMPDFDGICSAVFGANYRVSRYELAFLRCLSPRSFGEVLSLVVDDPGFDAITQKKTV